MFKNPMNFIYRAALSAAFVLLLAPQAAAQTSVPFSANFDGSAFGGANGNAHTDLDISANSTMSAWAGYANSGVRPHLTNGTTSTNCFRFSGNRSISFVASTSYGTTKHLLLPIFDVPVNELKISFWFCSNTDNLGELTVGYITETSGTASFVGVESFTSSAASKFSINSNPQPAGTGQTIEVSFSSVPATAKRIAIRWYNNTSAVAACGIDDVEVDFNATCRKVSNLAATTDYTSASISWTDLNSASRWQVSLNGGSPVTVTSTDYTFTGLTHNTEYTAQVKSVCSDDDISNPTM